MCSASLGHIDALETILKCNRLSIDKCSRYGQTALMKAILAGRYESVKILIAAGARVDISNKQGKSTLDIAKEKGHSLILNHILSVMENHKNKS